MTSSIMFRSPEARARIAAWFDRFHETLGVPTRSREVSTRFGATHVLVAGPEHAPPLVCLHGALASSAHLLGELGPLLTRYRVHAVDVLGQSVKSADARLPIEDDPITLKTRLYDEHRVEVPMGKFHGASQVRVSFQGYNDQGDLDALIDGLQRLL